MVAVEPNRPPESPPPIPTRDVHPGAWFGPQFGATAWLITGVLEFGAAAPAVALAWVACFVAANAIGWWLWRRRRPGRLARDAQLLALDCAAFGLLALVILQAFAPPAVLARGELSAAYRIVLIGGLGAMGLTEILHRLARHRERPAGPSWAAPGGSPRASAGGPPPAGATIRTR